MDKGAPRSQTRVAARGGPFGATTMRPELTFVFLFSVATAVAIAARRLKVPYTVALVVTGTALGSAHLVAPRN